MSTIQAILKDTCKMAFLLAMLGVILHIVDGTALTNLIAAAGYLIHGGTPAVAAAHEDKK